MTRAFISYSHVDEQFRAELQKHLTLLQRQGLLQMWNDHRIPAGGEFESHISAELKAADLVLLLVSPDFMASEYCYGVEMKLALRRHDARSGIVVPIIVRPCDWQTSPFGKLKALPRDGKPVVKWPTLDDAFLDVVQSLRSLVTTPTTSEQVLAGSTAVLGMTSTVVAPARPRSSALSLRKQFLDSDRDDFLDEGFTFIRAYFENSLQELGPRNPGYEGKFRQLSNHAFTGTVYRAGEKVAGCYIRLTTVYGRTRQIGYSGDDSAQDNSFNEMLSVEADDQSMFLKGLMSNRSGNEQKLTHEGAAEILWQLLIERLR